MRAPAEPASPAEPTAPVEPTSPAEPAPAQPTEPAEPAGEDAINGILQAALDAKAMAEAKAEAQRKMREAMEQAKATAAERIRRSAEGAKRVRELGSGQDDTPSIVSFSSNHHASREDDGRPCADKHSSCRHWARVGECSANAGYMRRACAESCGICAREKDDAAVDGSTGEAYTFNCVDEHPRCLQWAKADECSRNPGFMHSDCPVSCGTCETAERMSRQRVRAGLPP